MYHSYSHCHITDFSLCIFPCYIGHFTLLICGTAQRAAVTVFLQNFLALCASNYYNGCVFHRNIKGFIVQTGDPTGSI